MPADKFRRESGDRQWLSPGYVSHSSQIRGPFINSERSLSIFNEQSPRGCLETEIRFGFRGITEAANGVIERLANDDLDGRSCPHRYVGRVVGG